MSRWISGVVMVLAVVLGFVYASDIVLQSIVALMGVVLLVEIFVIAKRPALERLVGVLFYLFIVAADWQATTQASEILRKSFFYEGLPFLFFGLFVVAFLLQLKRKADFNEKIFGFLYFFGMVFYVSFAICMLIKLAQGPSRIFLAAIMILNFGADTGGYVVGKACGKHKIAPSLSPKKTWEGLLGGIVFSVILSVAGMYYLSEYHFQNQPPQNVFVFLMAALLGVFLTFTGLFGDLFQSMVKRHFGVKDSGNIIPGHGGLWDRLDSLLFSAPLFFVGIYLVDLINKAVK